MSNATDFGDGAGYERMMGRWSRKVGRQFLEWCGTEPGLDWLDVGCGNGAYTEEIIAHSQPRSICGIDPAPGQIAYARTREGTRVAAFAVGDAEALPYPDETFDVVTMGLVIAFVPHPERALAEMLRVTRPGGSVHTYMWDLANHLSPLAPMQRALRDMGLPAGSPPSSAISTRDGLEALWTSAGFRDVASTQIVIDVRFADFEDFYTTITTPLGPQADRLRSLSPEAHAELRQRLADAVPPAPDGSVGYPATANAVRGRV